MFVGIVAVAGITYVVAAGVTVEVDNRTKDDVRNVQIEYPGGSLAVAALAGNDGFVKRLGKIGEGAKFDVQWEQPAGQLRRACYKVYFGSTGYDTVRIRLLPAGESELVHDAHTYRSGKC